MTTAESCILCGCVEGDVVLKSYDRLFGIAPGTYTLVACKSCGLVRLSPRPTPQQIAGFYAANYWFAGGPSEELYRRLVLTDHVRFAVRAARESGAPGKVLDVGPSGGLFLRMMKERGFDGFGLDFSAEASRVALERNAVDVMVGDLVSAPIEPHSCALITMYHVVEHLLDPAAYLRAAARLLHPSGRLIVQVPDRDCWEATWLKENWTGLDVPRHIHVFRGSDLRRLLESCGFAIVREKHFSLRDHPAGLATGLAPGLDPVARAIRKSDCGAGSRFVKNLVYLALTVAALPVTWLEGLVGKGSSIMIEARVKG